MAILNLHRHSCALIIGVLTLSIAGCVTVFNPATGRQESLLIGTKQEVELGLQMHNELRQKMKFSRDPDAVQRLSVIGNRIAAASDRQDLEYRFSIVIDKELNAFATPGGFVYINSGLMAAATDDELAGVVAHEVGHIAARHSVKQMQGLLGMQMLLGIAGGLSGKESVNQTLTIVFDLVNLGYSRKDEFQADKLAVRYSRRAGFNPWGIIAFFRKLEENSLQKGRSAPPVFLSSHPPIEQRIAQVEQEINSPL
jgi:predicted Zn-dependent protease